MNRNFHILAALFSVLFGYSQQKDIPASYSNLGYDSDGRLYFLKDTIKYKATTDTTGYSLNQLFGKPVGTDEGITMDFGDFNGSVTYGLIPYGKAPHPLPVFRFTKTLEDGKAYIDIGNAFDYPYDFVNWKENKQLTLGYRLMDEKGMIVFDGEVSVTGTGPFKISPSIYEGPFLNSITPTSATIWFNTTAPIQASVEIDGRIFNSEEKSQNHQIEISGLSPNTSYDYAVSYAGFKQGYNLKTAPSEGSREAFVFGYTSDSRHATGGGERKIYGTNAYIMKKMAALAYMKEASFVQFTGDMINGYLNNKEEQHLQYTNWKKSIEPFWHYIPFYVGMGNHEAFGYVFSDENGRTKAFIDGFPYDTASAEAIFQEAFVNPLNGPESEDNNKYDPNPTSKDFPSYKESVFYYTYANTAIVVLNSDYWYAPTLSGEPATSGGLHGYLMDNQIKWLEQTLKKLEKNKNIDHIFVTQHTPAFPNGGHSKDDMWYSGNNEKRPYINGKAVEKGIIERRDEYLDLLINKSAKVVAILTGDEHNYNYLKITDEVPIYPENYTHKKIQISRPVYQINNGASGAPYYGQEILPWSDFTKSFSVENALCLFYVEGKSIVMKVFNPDTLNKIDEVEIR